MDIRIKQLRDYIFEKQHHALRRTPEELGIGNLSTAFSAEKLPVAKRAVSRLRILLEKETPVILPGEKIVFTRTITSVPDLMTDGEWAEIRKDHYIHERGTISNVNPDYGYTLVHGLGQRKEGIHERMERCAPGSEEHEFLEAEYDSIGLLQQFIGRYAEYACSVGEREIGQTLGAIREGGAKSFREALQLLRILHFTLWECGNYHNTLGRFDQYLYPFFIHDLNQEIVTREEALDLVEEFFIGCNKDSDLYPGMQQGDNGQSLVLGGTDPDGSDEFNELSELCLRASCELLLIDPKINLRVSKKTPLDVYELGSELTRLGLGFPQYCNDDVVIPGLVRKGYALEDAQNYVVAACWEFIIPGSGMDIPNIDALSLAECVLVCTRKLDRCSDFESFYRLVEEEMHRRIDAICDKHRNLYMEPSPLLSVLMDEKPAYHNYGIHGTGIATAVDSLAAVRKYYFDENLIDYNGLMTALDQDFEGYPELKETLRKKAPKMGQDNDYADSLAIRLLASFDRALSGKTNEQGGCYRAGTGTAYYYIAHSGNLGATPDGRMAGEAIPANYSPSLILRSGGPVSVIKSFAKPDLTKTTNGGPLTLEFDDMAFRNPESLSKLARLVRSFIWLGGHQFQLNTISREKLLDAKAHPDRYRNLIVRVWGWSGYFVELDEVYQDHIINRLDYQL